MAHSTPVRSLQNEQKKREIAQFRAPELISVCFGVGIRCKQVHAYNILQYCIYIRIHTYILHILYMGLAIHRKILTASKWITIFDAEGQKLQSHGPFSQLGRLQTDGCPSPVLLKQPEGQFVASTCRLGGICQNDFQPNRTVNLQRLTYVSSPKYETFILFHSVYSMRRQETSKKSKKTLKHVDRIQREKALKTYEHIDKNNQKHRK